MKIINFILNYYKLIYKNKKFFNLFIYYDIYNNIYM